MTLVWFQGPIMNKHLFWVAEHGDRAVNCRVHANVRLVPCNLSLPSRRITYYKTALEQQVTGTYAMTI
jgi:hypothetical protein